MVPQDYILTALADKTVIYVTHQVEFLPAADLILVWLCCTIFSGTFGHHAIRGQVYDNALFHT